MIFHFLYIHRAISNCVKKQKLERKNCFSKYFLNNIPSSSSSTYSSLHFVILNENFEHSFIFLLAISSILIKVVLLNVILKKIEDEKNTE